MDNTQIIIEPAIESPAPAEQLAQPITESAHLITEQSAEQSTCPPIGMTSDGAYMTPHRLTIFYHTASIFETCIAVLSARSQLIPIDDPSAVDYSVACEVCEHPTPEVLIFGNAFGREDILKFFGKYTDLVHIFVYNDAQSSKYYDTLEDGTTRIFDPRVVCFSINDLYQHTIIVNNIAAMYLIEHIICGTFPAYKSIIHATFPDDKTLITSDTINATTGKCIIKALKYVAASTSIGMSILATCSGIDAFDKIAELITKGKLIYEIHERTINDHMARGALFSLAPPQSAQRQNTDDAQAPVAMKQAHNSPGVSSDKQYKCWAINTSYLFTDIKDLALMHPHIIKSEADIVLLYTSEHHTVTLNQGKNILFPGWRITIFATQKSAGTIDLAHILSPFATGDVRSEQGMASAWVLAVHCSELLPFIYPQK